MSRAAAIQWVCRRDRAVVAGALAGIVALAWAYILLDAGMDTAMNMAMGDGALRVDEQRTVTPPLDPPYMMSARPLEPLHHAILLRR
jgi:predicted metal-binding membrane protein